MQNYYNKISDQRRILFIDNLTNEQAQHLSDTHTYCVCFSNAETDSRHKAIWYQGQRYGLPVINSNNKIIINDTLVKLGINKTALNPELYLTKEEITYTSFSLEGIYDSSYKPLLTTNNDDGSYIVKLLSDINNEFKVKFNFAYKNELKDQLINYIPSISCTFNNYNGDKYNFTLSDIKRINENDTDNTEYALVCVEYTLKIFDDFIWNSNDPYVITFDENNYQYITPTTSITTSINVNVTKFYNNLNNINISFWKNIRSKRIIDYLPNYKLYINLNNLDYNNYKYTLYINNEENSNYNLTSQYIIINDNDLKYGYNEIYVKCSDFILESNQENNSDNQETTTTTQTPTYISHVSYILENSRIFLNFKKYNNDDLYYIRYKTDDINDINYINDDNDLNTSININNLENSNQKYYINEEDIKYSIQPNKWCKVINNTISTENYHIFIVDKSNAMLTNKFSVIIPTTYKIYLPIYDENGNLCVVDNTLIKINTNPININNVLYNIWEYDFTSDDSHKKIFSNIIFNLRNIIED